MMSHYTPGIHTSIDFSRIGREETTIIRNLSEVWFITFVKTTIFKNSNYTYAFAKPTDKLTDSFHLEREVLVLLNSYQSFEPRSLDLVDNLLFLFRNRLDKLCIILVSQDIKVRDKIKNMTMQDPELKIIVPFMYNELLSPNINQLVQNRLKEFFFERDLFAYSSPLRSDNYFFGRAPIIQRLYDRYKSGENSGLFGLRKIGKTSVLYALRRNLDSRGEPSIIFDCEDTSFHKRRWNEALQFIILYIVRALKFQKTENIIANSKDYDEKNASFYFEEDLKTIVSELAGIRILMIFDEIENITFDISPTKHWQTGEDFISFWQSLRSVFQRNANLFSFVIAGVNPKCIETGIVNGHDGSLSTAV